MQIVFETTWLAPGQIQSADQFRMNGEQVVDEATFFRAATKQFFPRGNDSVEFSFVTHWSFSSTVAAEVFVLTHLGSLPMSVTDNGVLQCICGAENPGTAQTVYMATAVLRSARIIRYIGTSVDVEYTIVGPGFETNVPPNVPSYPNPNEQTIVFRRGVNYPLSVGVTTLAITFSSPFGTAPVVVCNTAQPSGSRAIFCRLLEDTVTVNGFTVEFSEPTYDLNCGVSWFACQ